MSKRVLLLEPYSAVAEVIASLLDDLDYEIEIVTSATIDENNLRNGGYHCVLINLDQNRSEWRNYGLKLAEVASKLGTPVIMIPDHETAAKTIDAKGWLRLSKPFTIRNLQNVIERAIGGASRDLSAQC